MKILIFDYKLDGLIYTPAKTPVGYDQKEYIKFKYSS